MDGFDEGNILIEKYFPHIKPEILTLDEWALSMAKVRFLQRNKKEPTERLLKSIWFMKNKAIIKLKWRNKHFSN